MGIFSVPLVMELYPRVPAEGGFLLRSSAALACPLTPTSVVKEVTRKLQLMGKQTQKGVGKRVSALLRR